MDDYEAFVDKFKPKLTTDDCYTPPEIYEAVKDWAVKEYHWEGRTIVRPFYPGRDYEHYNYPENCVVIDNPPFSIISQIARTYTERGIDYFLFAPHLTLLSIKAATCHIGVGSNITYDNGANVQTSFVASKGPAVRSAPNLYGLIEDIQKRGKAIKKELPKYIYPEALMTSSKLANYSKYGIAYESDGVWVGKLDAQKAHKKAIFGGGMLVPWGGAMQAAKAKPIVWELSPEEEQIIAALQAKEELQ